MTIHIKVRVYKTKKRARDKYNAIKALEKNVHSDWKTYPELTYKHGHWLVTQYFVYERRKPGRKRKRK